MRVQSARDGQSGTTSQIEQKRAQLAEMTTQAMQINAQLGQVKLEQDQYRTQIAMFKSNTQATEQQEPLDLLEHNSNLEYTVENPLNFKAQNQIVRRNIEQLESDLKSRNDELERERVEKATMETQIEQLRQELGKNQPVQTTSPNYDAFGSACGSPAPAPAAFNAFGGASADPFGAAAAADPFGASSPSTNDLFGGAGAVQSTDLFGVMSSPPTKDKQIVKYIASFQFDARNADELSFGEGDIVDVDINAPAEPEWFYGTCDGRRGLFPQAYVSLYQAAEEEESTSPFVPVQTLPVQTMPTTAIEGLIFF